MTKEGEKGGPLHINVESAGRTVLAYGYHLRVYGWVVVVKHARR